MAKFNFNLKNQQAKEKTAIRLVIRWNNKQLVYSTQLSANPKDWQSEKGKKGYQHVIVSGNNQELNKLNNDLKTFSAKASDAFLKYQIEHDADPPTPEILKQLLDEKFERVEKNSTNSFYGFIDNYIEQSNDRINPKTGKKINLLTVRKYKTTKSHLLAFEKKRKKEITFESIDLDFYYDYSAFLTNDLNLATNSIGKHIQILKTFLNAATDAGVNKTFGFKSSRFKVVNEESDSIYLTEQELTDIYNFDLSNNKRLEKVRDLFIVGSWTGLRFSDMTQLSSDHIKDGFLEIETQKTGEKVVIPIHSIVKEIFQKYSAEYGKPVPSAISNAKMNEYLKEIGKEMAAKNTDISLNQDVITTITRGGKKVSTRDKKYDLITTHTARRSFASNLFLDGVPALTIMKITGHKTERAFLKYIKITLNENAKILQMHWKNKELSKEPPKELSIAN